MIFQKIELSM